MERCGVEKVEVKTAVLGGRGYRVHTNMHVSPKYGYVHSYSVSNSMNIIDTP